MSGINPNSTRGLVLKTLHTLGQATVGELAEQVGVKAVTIRHHLNSLLAEGLVESRSLRQPVGRPAHVFRLSQEAEQLFPQAYPLLVDGLLEQLKDKLSPAMVTDVLEGLVDTLAAEIREELAQLSQQARYDRLVDWLNEKGFSATWEQSEGCLRLVRYHCPYHSLEHHHPELCGIDAALVQSALGGVNVIRETCLQEGAAACVLKMQEEESEEALPEGAGEAGVG